MTAPQDDIPRDPADNPELVAAYQQVVERYRGRSPTDLTPPDPPLRIGRTRPWLAALGVFATLALAYVWGIRPDWLFSRDATPTLAPAEEDASLRRGLYLEYHRVMEYRRSNGRVPGALDEAGDVEEGVEYVATGDTTFQLTASNERLTLELRQSDDPETVLDAAARERKLVR